MSQEFESDFEEIGCTHSGKKYKVDFRSSFFEDSLDSTRERVKVMYKLLRIYTVTSVSQQDMMKIIAELMIS